MPTSHLTMRDPEHLPHPFIQENDDDGAPSGGCAVCHRHRLAPIHTVPVGDRAYERHGPFGE